jgi:phosphatidylinositol alpha-mannosyltransferase
MVCPYSWGVPGGVQFHVRDLAEYFLRQGHEVSVMAPSEDGDVLPDYFTSAGRPVPVRYNGSVARLTFGPATSARVTRWLEAGRFEVLHLHEPLNPSASLMALWASTDEPVVATFHSAMLRSRALQAAHPLLRPSLEKIRGRITVSEEARETVRRYLYAESFIIPNGVHVDRFARATVREDWVGTPERPTLAFVGRGDEPRKGLGVVLHALTAVLDSHPGTRLLVAGPGDTRDMLRSADPRAAAAVEVLGTVSDEDKGSLLRSVDAYVAPHLGGESFGIVLVEAMAAGAPVIASDLAAFAAVLDEGRSGVLFETGSEEGLARAVLELLADPDRRDGLRRAGLERARIYDWGVVADRIMAVYETVIAGADGEPEDPAPQNLWGRLVRGVPGAGN